MTSYNPIVANAMMAINGAPNFHMIASRTTSRGQRFVLAENLGDREKWSDGCRYVVFRDGVLAVATDSKDYATREFNTMSKNGVIC